MSTTIPPVSGMKIQDNEFNYVRKIIHNYCGINIQEGKQALVQGRLMKRIRKHGLKSFAEYIEFVEVDKSGEEFLAMVDVLTTNKTSFFREIKHFEYIRNNILPEMRGRNVKWWAAGCSSGEEPITTAITLLEGKNQVNWNQVKILATDISRDILKVANEGRYPASKMLDVPNHILDKYFKKDASDYLVGNKVREMIRYGRLNLTEQWPLKGPFHVIMCRNVMIYFKRQTQREIINKFHRLLEPGGYLFLGHSESIPKENKGFKNLAPAVYQKH